MTNEFATPSNVSELLEIKVNKTRRFHSVNITSNGNAPLVHVIIRELKLLVGDFGQ